VMRCRSGNLPGVRMLSRRSRSSPTMYPWGRPVNPRAYVALTMLANDVSFQKSDSGGTREGLGIMARRGVDGVLRRPSHRTSLRRTGAEQSCIFGWFSPSIAFEWRTPTQALRRFLSNDTPSCLSLSSDLCVATTVPSFDYAPVVAS
jgi:hypothetical protein